MMMMMMVVVMKMMMMMMKMKMMLMMMVVMMMMIQVCDSCAAQAATTALEYCLCLAGEPDTSPRSVQQTSECTDGEVMMMMML